MSVISLKLLTVVWWRAIRGGFFLRLDSSGIFGNKSLLNAPFGEKSSLNNKKCKENLTPIALNLRFLWNSLHVSI